MTVMAMTLLRAWAVQSGASFDIFGDVFGDILGTGPGAVAALPCSAGDLRYTLDLTLEEAVFGIEDYPGPTPYWVRCLQWFWCKAGSAPKTCQTCNS